MKVASFCPPPRLVVLRVPWESKTPNRTSCPLGRKPFNEKVSETDSLSPTPKTTGAPEFVKYAQKPSEEPATGVTSKVTAPTWSVRTETPFRPLNSHMEPV